MEKSNSYIYFLVISSHTFFLTLSRKFTQNFFTIHFHCLIWNRMYGVKCHPQLYIISLTNNPEEHCSLHDRSPANFKLNWAGVWNSRNWLAASRLFVVSRRLYVPCRYRSNTRARSFFSLFCVFLVQCSRDRAIEVFTLFELHKGLIHAHQWCYPKADSTIVREPPIILSVWA